MDVLDIQQRPRQNDASTPAKRASPMKNLPPLALIAALAVAACSAPAATEAAPADTAKLDGSGDHPATPLADAPFTVQEVRSEERRVGKSVSVRVDLGGRRIIKKKKKKEPSENQI